MFECHQVTHPLNAADGERVEQVVTCRRYPSRAERTAYSEGSFIALKVLEDCANEFNREFLHSVGFYAFDETIVDQHELRELAKVGDNEVFRTFLAFMMNV